MTVMLEAAMPDSGHWTVDDLDRLPEDGVRRELIDGVLIVSPSPTSFHQSLAALLCVRLGELCPAEFDTTQAVEVRLGRRRSLIPDVLVTTADAAARQPHWFAPHEVALVVEVVSPTSLSFDRVAKPALYAQAGIPAYWRVETKGGVEVATYSLDATTDTYRETGSFSETITVDEPWPLRLPVASIIPRSHRVPTR